jgi:ferredoxin/flavodoxin---NADP+ reductase
MTTDVVIIGAGPAGLYASYYAGFRGLSCVVIDSLEEPGGQVSALYPEKAIYDVAGFPTVTGRELVDRLVAQAAPFGAVHLLGHRAEGLQPRDEGGFRITTSRGAVVDARAVIITGGIGTFTPRPLPGGAAWEGRGLVYFVREFAVMRDLRVMIVGGGDSAIDWALALEGIAASVTLVHRRDGFRAHEESVRRLHASSVDVRTFHEVVRLEGDERLERVVIADNRTHAETTVPVDAVVAALGFTADLGPLRSWGLAHDGRQLVVDTTGATSVPGVFAAGDVTTYPGKVPLIAVGFGEAATAVNNAAAWLDPTARVAPGHSSGG